MTFKQFLASVPITPVEGTDQLSFLLPNGCRFRFDDKPGRDPFTYAWRKYLQLSNV